ncbi:hypothetical protein EZS27_029407 [termite gut metagenome]|uniref:Uncharacterized protein n=1 Tax=termite gut metagenome TaxID=433724 RepID=A0A5J4QK02_9ZZZZ
MISKGNTNHNMIILIDLLLFPCFTSPVLIPKKRNTPITNSKEDKAMEAINEK